MQLLTQADFDAFVSAKPAAAIHFDTVWDVSYRTSMRNTMKYAEQMLGENVNFGEVDCDKSPELAGSIPVLNVPLVAYYRDGKLVASVIGANQDVRENLEGILHV